MFTDKVPNIVQPNRELALGILVPSVEVHVFYNTVLYINF